MIAPTARRSTGMTLIELVVALAVSGMAVLSGYQAYATLSDRRLAAVIHADSAVRAFVLREMIANWLSNARLTVEEDEVVFRSVDDARRLGQNELPSADLVFLTSARSPVGNHGTIVHLFVARDTGRARGLTAELSEWRGRRATRLQLDPAIAGISVEFSSPLGNEKGATSSWVSSTILPASLHLRFLTGPTDSLPPLLRLPLTIVIDASGGLRGERNQ